MYAVKICCVRCGNAAYIEDKLWWASLCHVNEMRSILSCYVVFVIVKIIIRVMVIIILLIMLTTVTTRYEY